MADPTLEQKLEDALNQIAALKEQTEKDAGTIERLTKQVGELQTGIGTAKDLPAEVLADARERMAAGLTREVALERAIHQHAHNKARHKELNAEGKKRVTELMEKNDGLSASEAIARAKHEQDLAAHVAATEKQTGKGK